MLRILILVLVEIFFFFLFASNYSALDGGNAIPVAIGLWGMLLSPVVFAGVVLADVVTWIKKKLKREQS